MHHLFGAYGQEEHTELRMGVKHHVMNYFNDEGINAVRLMLIENAPHNPMPTLPQITWEYFKQFRRDTATGKINQEGTVRTARSGKSKQLPKQSV